MSNIRKYSLLAFQLHTHKPYIMTVTLHQVSLLLCPLTFSCRFTPPHQINRQARAATDTTPRRFYPSTCPHPAAETTHHAHAIPMNVLHHAEEEPTSFASHRRLRVAVVPLGGVPDARFRSYLSLLQRSFSELPMANLSKPGSWKKENSPFKYFSWFDGSLSLQYLDRAPPSSAAVPEWQDYQAFRRTWAVSIKGVIKGGRRGPGEKVKGSNRESRQCPLKGVRQ